ncbi:hypothetical protein DOTSEDRAFT_69441 [Dothistroma septosporum NZE10]|uniref:Homeobox domain-containing protein n=1 Tax=Dothistroma septosporum (strain NZE10 / CBS 128990) TaxID=675120 RepID=N1PYL5_DOTSN|nr:hypothetical protein DOTSEDRAFT_69441 [Dothistroma septosporum NZE10]
MAEVMQPQAVHTPVMDSKSKMIQQSPTTPTSATASVNSSQNNASRRPPRKSTLTQQQKNQKRQRATQDQLMTLEVEFNKNPTPTALVRERIASEINMTERSVQIWFQNRRAKIKNIAKRSIESGEDCDSIPESMRQYLAMQAYAPGKGLPATMLGRGGPGFGLYGGGTLCLNTDTTSGKVVIQHFHCRSLSIGTWRRVGQSTMDLVIFYSPDKACVTYYINNDSAGYKIEYPFAWIKNITLEQGDVLAPAEGASQRSGGLVIELTRPPKFYMDSSGSGGFYECGDFTEDQQASQVLVHQLGGPSKVLSGQLAKLVSLEAYQNRQNMMFDPTQFAVSAPVSPIGLRPASQPNHMIHPHSGMSLYPPQDMSVGLMGPHGPRGHKRQRSRSVPVAVDFNMLRQGPMPSFLIQHEGQPPQAAMQDPNIFAPIPQHGAPTAFAPGPAGPHLSIDTSQGFNMSLQFNGSLSATTANSPSEYGTPGFFTAAPSADGMQQPHFSLNNGYLAVDAGNMIGTSNTPLSAVSSHGDPVIADHSPPLNGMGRSQSVDIFGTPGESAQLGSDEGLYLSDAFNKQIALPFRSPMSEEAFHSPMPDGMFNFQSPQPGSESQAHMNGAPQMNFPSPPNGQDGTAYNSPQHSGQSHQDSGVDFSTPPHDQTAMFNSQQDHTMLYQDSKMYSSPGQMQQMPPDDQQFYHHNSGNGFDMPAQQMFAFVDPHTLGRPQ